MAATMVETAPNQVNLTHVNKMVHLKRQRQNTQTKKTKTITVPNQVNLTHAS